MLEIGQSDQVQSELLLKSVTPCQTLWGNLVITSEVVRSIKEITTLKQVHPVLMDFVHNFYKQIAFPLSLFLGNLKLKNSGNEPSTIDPVKKEYMEMSFELLQSFIEIIYLVVRRIKKQKQVNVDLYTKSIDLIGYLEILLNLRVGDLFVSQRNLVFLPTTIEAIDQRITNLKLKVVEVMFNVYELIEYLADKTKTINDRAKIQEIKKKRDQFLYRMNGTIRLLCMSVIDLYSRENLDLNSIVNDMYTSDLLSTSLKFVGYLSSNYINMDTIHEFKFDLIHNVLLTNMVAQENEIINLTENPHDFVAYHFSIIEYERKEETLKISSAVTLDCLCGSIDGLQKYILHLLTNIVTVCLKMQNPNELGSPEDIAGFAQLMKSHFWTRTSVTSKIETCLLILAKFWESVNDRLDMILRFERFYEAVESHLGSNCESLMVQVRFMIFVGYYCDILFKEKSKEEKFRSSFQWVCNCINREDALGAASNDILILLGRNKFFRKYRQNYGEMLWKAVIMGLSAPAPSSSFLNLILEMLESFEEALLKTPNLFEGLIQNLVVLIQKISSTDSGPSKITSLNRVWNILRFACENPKLYESFGPSLEQMISQLFPLVTALKDPNANCDEDIVDCVIAWTKHSSAVSNTALGLISYFEQIQLKDNGRLNKLYILLNNFFRFAKDKFSEKDVFMVLKMAEACLAAGVKANDPADTKRSPAEKNSMMNENFSQGFLLLQLLIQTMYDKMTPEMVNYSLGLFTNIYEKYINIIIGRQSPLPKHNTSIDPKAASQYYIPDLATVQSNNNPQFNQNNQIQGFNGDVAGQFMNNTPGLGNPNQSDLLGENVLANQVLDDFRALEDVQESYFVDKMFGMFLLLASKFPEVVLPPFINTPQLEAKPFLHLPRILDVLYSRVEEFTTEYDRKLLIISLSTLIQFFLNETIKSESPQAYFLTEQLVCKTLLTIKLFQIVEKARKEMLIINTDLNQMETGHFTAHIIYERIQVELGISRVRPASNFDRFLQDHEFANGYMTSKETLVTELNSIYDNLNELKEFRKVMNNLRSVDQVYQKIFSSLRPVPKSHFVHVCFQFEDIDRGDHGKVYRRIVQLKRRRKK